MRPKINEDLFGILSYKIVEISINGSQNYETKDG